MEDVEGLDESQVDTTDLTVPPQTTYTSRLPVNADLSGDPWKRE